MTNTLLGTCQNCGKPASNRNAKFCGPECRNAPVYRICGNLKCATQFNAGRTRRLYCSERCRSANLRDPLTQPSCIIPKCGRVTKAKGYCDAHLVRLTEGRSLDDPIRTYEHPDGTVLPASHGYMRIKIDGDWLLEHRYHMAISLGRDLLPDENVHHKNGDRSDNTLENLELWTVSQPAGQRVQDKIDWAIEFLANYGYEVR